MLWSTMSGYTQKNTEAQQNFSRSTIHHLKRVLSLNRKTLHEVQGDSERVLFGQTGGISTRSLNENRGRKTDMPWQTTM